MEMCDSGPAMDALAFLQTQLHAVVDHEDYDEFVPFSVLLPRKSGCF